MDPIAESLSQQLCAALENDGIACTGVAQAPVLMGDTDAFEFEATLPDGARASVFVRRLPTG